MFICPAQTGVGVFANPRSIGHPKCRIATYDKKHQKKYIFFKGAGVIISGLIVMNFNMCTITVKGDFTVTAHFEFVWEIR
jgi:hypothetical protein